MTNAIANRMVVLDRQELVSRLIAEYETEIHEKAGQVAVAQPKKRNGAGRGESPQGIFLFDRTGRLLAVNSILPGMLGYSPEELHGLAMSGIFTEPAGLHELFHLMDGKGFVIDYRIKVRSGDGSVGVFLLSATIRWYNDDIVEDNEPLYKAWLRKAAQ